MKYGLIGGRLGHSYSKIIHERLTDYQYELCSLTEEEFHQFMKAKDFQAINVTIPYKQAVIPYLDELDDNAASIGAVNTIVKKGNRFIGHNTDYAGFAYMLSRHSISCEGKKVVILGNGGASKAVIAVVRDASAREIIVVNRHTTEGVISYEDLYRYHTDADLIINTTPVGMLPDVDSSPLRDLSVFCKCSAVLDVIYNPIETKLSKQATALGIPAVTGLEMLIAQAVYAIAYFLEQPPSFSEFDRLYHDICEQLA